MDIGIKEQYRGKNIATRIMEDLKNISTFIIAETQNTNIGANKALEKTSLKLTEINDRNIYLLHKERIEEFMDNGYFEKLTNHYTINCKKDLIKK